MQTFLTVVFDETEREVLIRALQEREAARKFTIVIVTVT